MLEFATMISADKHTAFLRAQFDDSPLGYFLVNNHAIIEYLNPRAATIIGFGAVEEGIKASLQDIDSIMNCGLMEAFGSILGGRVYLKRELSCSNRQGHFAILNIFCSPFRGEGGEIIGVFGIIQDVTESSKKKAELEEAIFELSIMSQVSEVLSSTADLDEVLKVLMTGVTANQGLGFNRAFLFLADNDEEYLEGKIAVGPGSPEEAGQIWSRLSREQRSLKELLDDYSERENQSNYSLSSLISGWKISLEENSFFSEAINNGYGINAHLEDFLSGESLEILKRLNTWNLAVAPIISKGKKLGIIAADNQITGKKISSSDVNLLQTFANHTAVAIERSRLYDNLVEHATELEEINRQLAESQEQIIRVEKMSVIGELTSSIAHELRNPLTVIGGFANLMLSAGGNEANSEYLNIILSETKRAENVLHHVLDFSRASRTKTQEIDFNHLVVRVTNVLAAKTKHRHTPPLLKLSEQKLAIWGNPDQLEHALLQFMLAATEELTDDCRIEFGTKLINSTVRSTIGFIAGHETRDKVIKVLKQIFGSPTGTQKLSIIVAGETLRYHGGNYGIESSSDDLPKIFIELPQYKGGYDEQASSG
jgi:PAS domain S-box-containing protein